MATNTKTEKQTASPGEDMVPIMLFRDNGKYKDDQFVAVNGKTCQIRRGERVEITAMFAEVLENSMKQDNATADLIARQTQEFAFETKARGF